MTRRTRLIFAAAATVVIAAAAGQAYAAVQADTSAELRATGRVGEQWNGYLGAVVSIPAPLRARMDSVNIKRRAYYTALAASRRVKIEEVGAAMACDIFRDGVLPGQYYQLADGVWRQREGALPIDMPDYCG